VAFFCILATCGTLILLLTEEPAGTDTIICQNNLKCLGYALSLYECADSHFGELPPSWLAATNSIAKPVKLHFVAGTRKSPLSQINNSSGCYGSRCYYFVSSNQLYLEGHTADYKPTLTILNGRTQEVFDTNGLYVDAIGTPALLICPADTNHQVANSWEELTASNISYEYVGMGRELTWGEKQIAGADYVTINDSKQVLCVCQVHSRALLSDGSVQSYAKHPERLKKINGQLYYSFSRAEGFEEIDETAIGIDGIPRPTTWR
jgi:hypothetical protein